jgi:cytochrome c biogenesis protein CcmG, thiol:disulfide interchange protein DsbE
MKRLVLLLAASALLAGCTSAPSAPSSSSSPDPRAVAAARAKAALAPCPAPSAAATRAELPDLTLPCLGGGADVSLARLGGVPMVLNAWAHWCGPCREELPAFGRLGSAVPPDRLRVLGVATEDSAELALEFSAAVDVHLPAVLDEKGKLKNDRRQPGLPFTLFVRADGSVASVHVGPLTYQQLVAAVREQLGVRVG